MVYAVIDTNIFVSALIIHNSNASTARVLENLLLHRIIPLYNDDIIKEYDEDFIVQNSSYQKNKSALL